MKKNDVNNNKKERKTKQKERKSLSNTQELSVILRNKITNTITEKSKA